MTRLTLGNVSSTLEASSEVLATVRHHVSYQKRAMPPLEAQRTIKRYFSTRRRYGGASDLNRLFSDGLVCAELEEYGVTSESLTRATLEQILRGGIWSGWVRLVGSDGSFLTGLLPHVQRALTLRAAVDFEVIDERAVPARLDSWGTVPLYGYQQRAVENFIEAGRGVVNLPPRSGKTRIAVAVAASLGVPTLYIAPTIGIVNQTVRVFRDLLPTKTTIGMHSRLSSSAKTFRDLNRADVIVTTPKTALKVPNVHSRLLLVLDEFHHSAAKTWQAASAVASGAYWRLGLTGTHYRADGRDMEMAGVLGREVYRQSVAEMVEIGRLVPARIAMLRVRGTVSAQGYDIYKEGVVEHAERNRVLAAATTALVGRGRRVLVLAKEIEHAARLSSMVVGSVAVDGRDNDRVDEMLKRLARGEVSAVVGTSVIGEGRDVPAADALVYASGGRSKVRVVQDYFRALTASEGKAAAIVVDAGDTHHDVLLNHAAHRLTHYRAEPAFDAEVIEPGEFEAWLDDNRTSGDSEP